MKFDESLKRKQYVSPEMKIKMIDFRDILTSSIPEKEQVFGYDNHNDDPNYDWDNSGT